MATLSKFEQLPLEIRQSIYRQLFHNVPIKVRNQRVTRSTVVRLPPALNILSVSKTCLQGVPEAMLSEANIFMSNDMLSKPLSSHQHALIRTVTLEDPISWEVVTPRAEINMPDQLLLGFAGAVHLNGPNQQIEQALAYALPFGNLPAGTLKQSAIPPSMLYNLRSLPKLKEIRLNIAETCPIGQLLAEAKHDNMHRTKNHRALSPANLLQWLSHPGFDSFDTPVRGGLEALFKLANEKQCHITIIFDAVPFLGPASDIKRVSLVLI